MNKFLKRVKKEKKAERISLGVTMERDEKDLEALLEFQACWASLAEVRRKARRAEMYTRGDQWGDVVRDPDTGSYITERELIKKQGKVPLKNNMVWPIVNNVEGQFRSIVTKPVCVVRDQREAKIGEMMSAAIEYAHDLNDMQEVDAASLRTAMSSGIIAQRLEYGPNFAKGNRTDVWAFDVNSDRIFFNTSIEDARGWDITHIGEIMDLTFDQIMAAFGKSAKEKEMIRQIYGDKGRMGYDYNSMTREKDMDFYSPAETDLCRVVFGWRLENREAYFCHDTLRGIFFYVPKKDKYIVDETNRKRKEEGLANGVAEEDILLIDMEEREEQYWVYRYMSPDGYCLDKGESPYWHGGHNYVLSLLHFSRGCIHNFVEQFIDQQRSINRTAMLIDFIRSTSSKGLLVVDESAFDSMSREEIVDEYVRYNGVLFVKPKQGVNVRDVIHQFNGAASTAGDYELLNLQLKLINEISGVNSAMQGHAATSGTPASLYAQQVQNSSLNLKSLFGRMASFRRNRDMKLMQMIQQFYTDSHYIGIAGRDYSEEAKWYNPEKVMNADFDLTLTDGNNTPAYQMLANEFLMQLFQAQAIDVKTMLENSSYPFAAKILEAIKNNEQQAMEQQQMAGVPQVPVENPLMQRAMDNNNASELDGIRMNA